MKKLILSVLVIMMTVCSAYAGTYTIEWDANDQVVDGYRLYTSEVAGGQYVEPVQEVGNVTTLTTAEMAPGNHCFVLTAFKGELESSCSNEVCGVMPLGTPRILKLLMN